MKRHLRIALIDDDWDWVQTLAEYLEGNGYEIRTAADGTSGLALLERERLPLAVVDYHMPDMDGLQLLRALRGRRHRAAVLMVSGDDDPELPGKAKREGAFAFYPKTAPPRLLLHGVGRAWQSLQPTGENDRN